MCFPPFIGSVGAGPPSDLNSYKKHIASCASCVPDLLCLHFRRTNSLSRAGLLSTDAGDESCFVYVCEAYMMLMFRKKKKSFRVHIFLFFLKVEVSANAEKNGCYGN